jgi:hypothetical protein
MKQIGLATHAYHDTHGCFPVSWTILGGERPWLGHDGFYSHLTRILPYIALHSVYNTINYETGTFPVNIPFCGRIRENEEINVPN